MRKSLRDQCDPVAFEREKALQAALHPLVAAGNTLIVQGSLPPLVSLMGGNSRERHVRYRPPPVNA